MARQNFLIVEDIDENVEHLKYEISKISQSLNVSIARNLVEAQNLLKNNLFHIVSLDQRIPYDNQKKELTDSNFTHLLRCLNSTQPFATGVVFTSHADLQQGIEATRSQLEYIDAQLIVKKTDGLEEWSKCIKSMYDNYFQSTLMHRAKKNALAPFIKSVQQIDNESESISKFLACRDLVENSCRLFALLLISIGVSSPSTAEQSRKIMIKLYKSRLNNIDWQACLTKIYEYLVINSTSIICNDAFQEIRRFFESGSDHLLNSINDLRERRNKFSHDHLQMREVYDEFWEESKASLQNVIESVFLFSMHPILGDIKLQHTNELPYRYRAKDFREERQTTPVIDIFSSELIGSGGLHWCYLDGCNAMYCQTLSPLVVSRYDKKLNIEQLYYLSNYKKAEYTNINAGNKIVQDHISNKLKKFVYGQ